MNTAEKVQVSALLAIFLFLAYITVYTVRQTLEWQERPRRVYLPRAKAQQEEKETQKPSKPEPAKKGAKLGHSKKSQDLFTRGQRKASTGDCEGAIKDLDAAASLDASLKTQIPSALDSCKQK